MSEAIAQDQLQSFFDRWQRLEDQKAATSEDLKALFSEAKDGGFDTKVMRKVFRDKIGDAAEREEFEAVYELYAAALGMVSVPRAHPARTRELKAFAAEERHEPVDWDELAARVLPDDSPVRVYFIEAPSLGLIKIGSTGMVDRRVAAIRRAIPVPTALIGVISGGAKREVELHEKYAAHRVHGEWFAEAIRPELELLLAGHDALEEFPPDEADNRSTAALTEVRSRGALDTASPISTEASDQGQADAGGDTPAGLVTGNQPAGTQAPPVDTNGLAGPANAGDDRTANTKPATSNITPFPSGVRTAAVQIPHQGTIGE